MSYRDNINFLKYITQYVKIEGKLDNLQFYNHIKKYFYFLFERNIKQNKDVILNTFNKKINFYNIFEHLHQYSDKNILKKINFINFYSNFLKFKSNISKLTLDVNSIIVSNELFKKKIYYKRCISSILNFLQIIYSFNDFIHVNYENYVKKINRYSSDEKNKDLVQNNWVKAIHKQLLVFFFKSKKVVELFLDPKNLGSLFIRLKIKKKKLIKLDLISNNSIARELLKFDVPNLRNTTLKTGIRFEDITIRSHNSEEIDIFKNNYNHYNKIKNNEKYTIYNKKINGLYKLFSLELYNSIAQKNIVDIYV
ncbi:MAG: hypothetical protein UAS51_00355 [Buchnera aphidicola (Floraphis meitanensis)]